MSTYWSQLHGQRQHGGGALRLGIGACRGTCDLLQAAGFGARLGLGDLFAQLCLANLGILQLLGKLLDLHGLLLHLGILLLGLGSMLLSELLGLSDLVLRFLKALR